MLIVELLVLFLILAEFVWKVVEWRAERKRRKQQQRVVDQNLDSLGDSLADSVMDHVLHDRRPSDAVGTRLFGKSEIEIVERDYTGWKFSDVNKPLLKAWAKKRKKRTQ
jgi:hypothetical protein